MKLSSDFLVHHSGKETVVVPTGNAAFSGIVKGNDTFGEIVELLKKDTTEEEIITKMMAQYDAPRKTIEKDVVYVVGNLRKIGALDE